jgi:hypothetical protein
MTCGALLDILQLLHALCLPRSGCAGVLATMHNRHPVRTRRDQAGVPVQREPVSSTHQGIAAVRRSSDDWMDTITAAEGAGIAGITNLGER